MQISELRASLLLIALAAPIAAATTACDRVDNLVAPSSGEPTASEAAQNPSPPVPWAGACRTPQRDRSVSRRSPSARSGIQTVCGRM